MVKRHLTLLFFVASLLARANLSTGIDFRMEFSKPEIYYGEQVLCHFNIFTSNELIEVEVAKFPEFRGFWNENISLRQGPISTLFGITGLSNTATVGTYLLIPMLGQSKPTIEPMKIVLRTPATRRIEGSQPPEFMLSQSKPLVIKPLPPIPASMSAEHFVGAVGKFMILTQAVQIPFQLGEPTLVQVTVSGQGNFQEINDLPIAFPPQVEVVSRRSYLQGAAQSGTKTFEYSLTVKNGGGFNLPHTPFIYFDPDLKRYGSLMLPELHFIPLNTTTAPLSADKTARESSLELRESAEPYRPWRPLPWLLAFHLMMVGLVTTWLWRKRPPSVPTTHPERDWLVNLFGRMRKAWKAGDTREVLSTTEAYVFAWIASGIGVNGSAQSRQALLELANDRLTEAQANAAGRILQACREILYRPENPEIADLKSLLSDVLHQFPLERGGHPLPAPRRRTRP